MRASCVPAAKEGATTAKTTYEGTWEKTPGKKEEKQI
jgi:hypothetical protein